MTISVLDAIRDGDWDYEPPTVKDNQYVSTKAMPGSKDKVQAMAERIEDGLPLWHPEDRISYDEID